MGFKEWDKKLVASIVLSVTGLAMLIAGSVMLGIGVSKANEKANCSPCPTCQTCSACPALNPTAVYTNSYTDAIQYSDSLKDSNSAAFKKAAESLSKNITSLLNTPVSQVASLLDTSVSDSTVVINSFKPTPSGKGVNFYASILYSYNGSSSADVQKQLNTMYPTNANTNPTSTQICSSLAYPPGESTTVTPVSVVTTKATTTTAPPNFDGTTSPNAEGTTATNSKETISPVAGGTTPNALATTTVVATETTTAKPLTTLSSVPDDVYCHATGPDRSIVFLIDTAVPAQGTLDDKLTKIRTFLSKYGKWIGLRDLTNWGGVQMQYTTYLTSKTLAFINAGPTRTQARSVIIVSDGFDPTNEDAATNANTLKSTNVQIGAFLASTNPLEIDQFRSIVTSTSFLYGMSSLDFLADPTIDSTMASWSCQAPYPVTTTSTSTTPAFTPSMPKTTTNALTTTTSPAEISFVRPCNLYVDVIIIAHASSSSNYDIFIMDMVFTALTGPLNDIDRSYEDVKIGVALYTGNKIDERAYLSVAYSTLQMAQILNETNFISTNDTNLLSKAYSNAYNQFYNSRRLATPTVLVITDEVDQPDNDNAVQARLNLPSNSFVYGIRVGYEDSGPIPGQNDGILVTDIQQLNPQNTNSSIIIANMAANALCRYIPHITTTIPTPTQKPIPRPVPLVKPRNVWPDIAILIDATLQNVSFLETQRDFLQKTFLNSFKIGGKWSKFTIATYNNMTSIVCQFSDINTYWDLELCLNTNLTYNAVASVTRDIDQALSTLTSKLYSNVNSGYKSEKENFVFVFTNGKSTTKFYQSATSLKSKGVRLIGVDISSVDGMTPLELSDFGPDSYKVSNWLNPAVNDELSQSIIVQTTMKKKPSFSLFFADFYIVVDNSLSQSNDLLNVQQFVKQFYDQLNINPHHSRISIVPFSDSVMSPLELTDNSQVVLDYLNKWRNADPGKDSSNIGAAITNVLNQHEAKASDTSSQIIYLIGANSTSGADEASAFVNLTQVTSYVLTYNPAAKYTGYLVDDPSFIYKVDGSANLLNWVEAQFPVDPRGNNPMNQFFLRVTDVQEDAITANFPMSQVAMDIVIILDETGLTQEDFESVKQFIFNFTNSFTIDTQLTHFALQTLSGSKVPQATWTFNDCVSNEAINKRIDSMKLDATPANASADLNTAVSNVLSTTLTQENGWRNRFTTTIIINNALTIVPADNESDLQKNLQLISQTYGWSLQNQYVSNVMYYVKTYNVLPTPESLSTIDDNYNNGERLLSNIYQDYKYDLYPPIRPFNQTGARYVFLVDNTNATQNQAQIQSFLFKFAAALPYHTISVVNYNSQGVIKNTSWTLEAYAYNNTQLNNAIQNLQILDDTKAPNLNAINQQLAKSVMANINLKYFTFAIQYNDNTVPFDYLPQFLGSDYAEDFLYVNDLSTYDTSASSPFSRLNDYIQSEAMAWRNSN